MDGLGIIGSIIIGIIAGWIAEKLMGHHHGLITNLIVGLVGGLIGGFLADVLHVNIGGPGWLDNLIFAAIGAVILLFVLGLVKRPRT